MLQNLIEKGKTTEKFTFDSRDLSVQEVLSFLECGKRILDVQKGTKLRKMFINVRKENINYA